ncbi:MAG: class I SAM-dependent methyltransferase [Moorea sp. SIO3I7]|uniref:class I SAM-dependent methyltransferase n=1 Tax=Moorena sp. SIO3I8 TaxID=2607833 RepID=UPI0013C12384|nr:class I SAM-dependent methyltransferase [Moorena sp. SIO3I8]NEN99743.1 class I SAM-dependent methyltransferase [Moorena sp. SIO3I7]NEO06321.1 class I SAM-dependent methyltransferase [Moorena sp. SIO3I8]
MNFESGYQGLKTSADPQRWSAQKEVLTDEKLVIEGHPVMERWETPYMGAFAALVTRHGGRILECGFGLGISAHAIQSYAPEEHVIIEANDDVFKRLIDFQNSAVNKVTPILGLACDVLESFSDQSFDGIFYDTYPLNADEQHTHQFPFIKKVYPLLKKGGILSYCNLTSTGVLKNRYDSWEALFNETQVPYLIEAGVPEKDIKGIIIFKVYPPTDCLYFQHKTAMIPIIVKE